MERHELQRLIKIESRIQKFMEDNGLKCLPVEFDVVPAQKMLEIQAYRSPSNISSWKFGRDYEKYKTIYDKVDAGLPYEVVINDNPARAYLMNSNTFAVHALVIAHVYAHVNFFTESKWFQNSRRDIMGVMSEANRRFNEYERLYGIDAVEKTVDAGHALQWHSSPFDTETEDEKRTRVYNQQRKLEARAPKSEFNDLTSHEVPAAAAENYENYNANLWRHLKMKTPVEPTGDLLRYIIDNSRVLEDWQKDILETLRTEGQYYWANIRTKYMNEGWATYWHEKMLKVLFNENYLDASEHGQYNYSNSLVKARNPFSLNPYLIGSSMYKEIKERWDKGRYGMEYDNCIDYETKKNWDTGAMEGDKKIREVMRSYTDWFFMQDFLTADTIDKLDMYIYQEVQTPTSVDYVRTGHTAEEVREIIVTSFSNSGIPKINIINGDHDNNGSMVMDHEFAGMPLDVRYTEETMRHMFYLWGRPIHLKTVVDGKEQVYSITPDAPVPPIPAPSGRRRRS